jgi:hypothetical protein
MPQLVKGGKWVFGWTVVSPDGTITIPPDAWSEYGYHVGEDIVFIAGSRRHGGFGLGTPRLLQWTPVQLDTSGRVLGWGKITQECRVSLPPEIGVKAGQRLLVARGSGRALGFLVRGPILETALEHPEIEVYEVQ